MKIRLLAPLVAGLFLCTTGVQAQGINQAKITVPRPAQVRVVKPAAPPRVTSPVTVIRIQAPRVQTAPRVQITPHAVVSTRPILINNGNQYLTNYPYPLLDTPANRAKVRNDAWAAYRASLQAPTDRRNLEAGNTISLKNNGHGDQLGSPNRFNFQYSNSDIRSVQQSLRRLGLYAGLTDGYFGAETQQAIEAYQVNHGMAVTGQPDLALYSQLGIVR